MFVPFGSREAKVNRSDFAHFKGPLEGVALGVAKADWGLRILSQIQESPKLHQSPLSTLLCVAFSLFYSALCFFDWYRFFCKYFHSFSRSTGNICINSGSTMFPLSFERKSIKKNLTNHFINYGIDAFRPCKRQEWIVIPVVVSQTRVSTGIAATWFKENRATQSATFFPTPGLCMSWFRTHILLNPRFYWCFIPYESEILSAVSILCYLQL